MVFGAVTRAADTGVSTETVLGVNLDDFTADMPPAWGRNFPDSARARHAMDHRRADQEVSAFRYALHHGGVLLGQPIRPAIARV
jgi:hypothetical protein